MMWKNGGPNGDWQIKNNEKEKTMYLYWRVQQDLNCLGEVIHFHDPALIRSLKIWVRKNYTGIIMAQGSHHEGGPDSFISLN